jgi:hypothetical protein
MPDQNTDQPPITDPPPFPLNRVVAFLGPHIAWIAGLLATWLVTHFPGLNIDGNDAAEVIAQAITFLVVTAVTYAGAHKWLTGWQAWAYGLATGGPGVTTAAVELPPEGEYDPNEFEPEPAPAAGSFGSTSTLTSVSTGTGGNVSVSGEPGSTPPGLR